MAAANFLSLPRELRDTIYSYILPKRIQLVSSGCASSLEFWHANGILLANQQLRNEALHSIQRSLPTMTIVVQLHTYEARSAALTLPEYTSFRQSIVNLIIRTEYQLRRSHRFSLSHKSEEHTKVYLYRIFENMPTLRRATCEITWEPNRPPALLLPRIREHMLGELKRVTIGSDSLIGWDIECEVRDVTRWKNEWSGVVVLQKQ